MSDQQRFDFGLQLIRSGARYVVCGGVECEAWHDSVDLAWATDYADGNQPAEVMTSWHTDESAVEVVWFFLMNTNFDHHTFTRFLILVIGDDDNMSATLLATVENTLSGKAPQP